MTPFTLRPSEPSSNPRIRIYPDDPEIEIEILANFRPKTCGCGERITGQNKSGLCRRCQGRLKAKLMTAARRSRKRDGTEKAGKEVGSGGR